jgi:coatomer protein complex subunit gamma
LETDKNYILNSLATSVVALESALQEYLKTSDFQKPFDIKTVPEQSVVVAAEKPKQLPAVTAAAQKSLANTRADQAEELKKVPELSRLNLGPLFKSTPKQMLTESETEYLVEVVKHIYKSHLVLQFRIENTLADQLLENVKVG